jgi:alpha-tubulin suppressor-like RCC1 family protein
VKSDGTLACWGFNLYGQTEAPAGTFVQVSAGYAHTCAVKSDGTLACWGYNGDEQATPPPGTFVQVDTGIEHSCGVRSNGTIICWGDNHFGQLFFPRAFLPMMTMQ